MSFDVILVLIFVGTLNGIYFYWRWQEIKQQEHDEEQRSAELKQQVKEAGQAANDAVDRFKAQREQLLKQKELYDDKTSNNPDSK